MSGFLKSIKEDLRRMSLSENSGSSHSHSQQQQAREQHQKLLFQAVTRGDTGQCATLIALQYVDKDARDGNGTTALSYACHYGHTEMVQYLVHTAKCNIESVDFDGDRALHIAVEQGHAKIVQVLVEAGAEIFVTNRSGTTPLDMARSKGDEACVRILEQGGSLSLHKACKHGHKDKLATLIAHGFDKDAQDKQGCTPLIYACYFGHLDTVKYLVEVAKADKEAGDFDGDRPIHVACEKGRATIVQFLLKCGVETSISNYKGFTPAQIAKQSGFADIEQMILENDKAADKHKKKKKSQNTRRDVIDLDEDRSKLQFVLTEPQPPVVLTADYIDYLAHNGSYLSKGAFGVVYKSVDQRMRWTFALKMVLYPVQDEEDRLFVENSIETEIAALSMARHPSIIRMYGYRLDGETSKHAILFEYAARGSVASVLDNESERALFSGTKRLHVLLEVFRAVQFLHQGGAQRKTPFLHRDLKSANICLTENYSAKLIDCGLGKLVNESQESVMKAMSSGSRVFGTDGYTCPWYSKGGGKKFKPACDVYSLGIVMMEFITGCLQGNQSSTRTNCLGDFRTRYLEDEDEEKIDDGYLKLIEDADNLAGWESDTLHALAKLAVWCCHEKTKERPSTADSIKELSTIIHSEELGSDIGCSIISTAGPLKKGAACVRCNCPEIAIQCEHKHGLCGNCLDIQIERNLHIPTITCPADRCFSRPYSRTQLEYAVCPQLYTKHREYADFQSNLFTLLGKNALQQSSFQDQVADFMEKSSQDQERLATVLESSAEKQHAFQHEVKEMLKSSEMNQEQRMMDLADAINSNSEQQVELHLKLLREMSSSSNSDLRAVMEMNDRILRGLTHYIAGTKEVCPRWIVFEFPGKKTSRKGAKSFFRSFSKAEAHLYLVCQHSHERLEKPIVLEVTRKWIQQLAPALKFTLIAIKLACAVAGVSLGGVVGNSEYAEQNEFYSELLQGIGESAAFDSLQNRIDSFANGDSATRDALGEDGQMAKLTEASYQILSEKLLKEKRAWWKDHMKAVMNKDGHVIYVKNKYAKCAEYTPITAAAAQAQPVLSHQTLVAQNQMHQTPSYQSPTTPPFFPQGPKPYVPAQQKPMRRTSAPSPPRTARHGKTKGNKSTPAPHEFYDC